jgi:hypothetical protein
VRQISDDVVAVTAPIYFLPESKLSEREKLEFVLRDLCGVEVSAPEPVWISEFVTPGQEEVDRELAELEVRMREMSEERERKVEERAKVREPLKLLYETGAALEESVRFVLAGGGRRVVHRSLLRGGDPREIPLPARGPRDARQREGG